MKHKQTAITFTLPPNQALVATAKSGVQVAMGVDHDVHIHEVSQIDETVRVSLVEDLRKLYERRLMCLFRRETVLYFNLEPANALCCLACKKT